jgi:hypothetical protein
MDRQDLQGMDFCLFLKKQAVERFVWPFVYAFIVNQNICLKIQLKASNKVTNTSLKRQES